MICDLANSGMSEQSKFEFSWQGETLRFESLDSSDDDILNRK